MTKKFLIITSIFPPTKAVQNFAQKTDWSVIVVGDKKSPQDWQCENVTYLSPAIQESLNYSILNELPWNHYCRKMVGYLYAMQQGADIIAESDDDNIPYDIWPTKKPLEWTAEKSISGANYYNVYEYFTDQFVWPRGYPLREILSPSTACAQDQTSNIGVWQFLADGDPDVDALYRLTNNRPVTFRETDETIALQKGCVCPFNSQNTIFRKEFFSLLYLPAFVTFRFTDILRGLIAQPILWANNSCVGFGGATVFQERNQHDYLKDLESEVPLYLQGEEATEIAKSIASDSASQPDNLLVKVYEALCAHNIVKEEEVSLVSAWAKDVRGIQSL